MNEFNSFFSQGYWWLSLFGGLHCIGLGLYIRYVYREGNGNNKLLGSIFSLMGLYFFTGMLNRDNSPVPIHLLFTLIIPFYFLLMPLLYLYCYRSLNNIKLELRLSAHFYLALIVALAVLIISIESKSFVLDFSNTLELGEFSFTHLGALATLLPGMLSIQTLIYFILIIEMLRRYKGRSRKAHQESLQDIKFHWLLVLTLALMCNWLVRTLLVILPFYLGDQISEIPQAMARLLLLLTVYVLAIYGLKQITKAAYLRGKLNRHKHTLINPLKTSNQLLNSEELNYLHQLMREDNQEDEKQHQ
ncbi:hypothetical protein GCM10007978_27020 [Shewanella hanedai]|uniref:Uncharacterized protein n=1 Tax=Shewanella hanedai TaxID=25 RepID=A0A553JLS9_SHEHA|nr:hypothetical protein [Shewanella hanedai]TRY13415.1 hypothetical protein FN961_15405 [Shewanella hanedai]GGI87857.1 hypothetical protein GCM10007978_27020 [Shewanella hanedai]